LRANGLVVVKAVHLSVADYVGTRSVSGAGIHEDATATVTQSPLACVAKGQAYVCLGDVRLSYKT
jgi:hypothetical protein